MLIQVFCDSITKNRTERLNEVLKQKIRYNKLRKLKKAKKRHGLQNSGRMKLRHTILKGDSKPCPKKLYS